MKKNRFKSDLDGLLLALQFFTIVPVSKQISVDHACLKRTIQYYPLIGAAYGTALAFLVSFFQMYMPFSDAAVAFLLLTIPVVLTGGLHLDGWMDCSDAYFSYRDRKKRLEIMKDPRVGSFAVLSLLFLLAWRYLFIFESIAGFRDADYFFIMLIPFLSRLVMGSVFIFGTPAKDEGLAAYFKAALEKKDSLFYAVYVIVLAIFAVLIFPETLTVLFLFILAALLSGIVVHRFVQHQFGGTTGDTLGATIEGVETWLWMILWLLHVFVTG
jgi:adenosylcobinamide-GDP ribazoletransferase